jgi:hypothetical protein
MGYNGSAMTKEPKTSPLRRFNIFCPDCKEDKKLLVVTRFPEEENIMLTCIHESTVFLEPGNKALVSQIPIEYSELLGNLFRNYETNTFRIYELKMHIIDQVAIIWKKGEAVYKVWGRTSKELLQYDKQPLPEGLMIAER